MARYIAPTFLDNSPPPLSAENINAMAKAAEMGQVIRKAGTTRVTTDMWYDDGTYSQYPYIAEVEDAAFLIEGIPTVYFSLTAALSGNFAPFADIQAGVLIIYAREIPTTTTVIQSITVTQYVSP